MMSRGKDVVTVQRAKVTPMNRGYEPSRVVHLRNLPEDIDMDDVMELGRPFGPVISALRIKETQAFLYMQELKDAEELVNEYRQHPPKIGWRTVFVQFSQYTRLDVGARKPDPQGRRAAQNTGSSEKRARDRSRERGSRRSLSPDSPPSPPLPDITVPFYMLPRPDEPELSIPPTASRPQLVSYPHLANTARPLAAPISYPPPASAVAQQRADNTAGAGGGPMSSQLADADQSASLSDTAADDGQAQQQPPYQPAAAMTNIYDERACQPAYYNNSTVHSIANHQHHQHHRHQHQQPVPGQLHAQIEQPESLLNCLHTVIEQIAADAHASRHQTSNELAHCVSEDDMSLVDMLQHEFGEHSLPAVVSTIFNIRQLDADTVSALVSLGPATVHSVTRLHSFAGVDDFTALFLRVAQTVTSDADMQTAPALKRRRYDADDYVSNFSPSSSAAAAMYSQQNQSWTSDGDYH